MKWLNNVKEQVSSIRIGARRLSEVLGTGTAFPDGEKPDLVSKPRSDRTGQESQGFSKSVCGKSSSTDTQFINGRCRFCNHLKIMHFIDTDSLGTWSFCYLSICDCFVDMKEEDAT